MSDRARSNRVWTHGARETSRALCFVGQQGLVRKPYEDSAVGGRPCPFQTVAGGGFGTTWTVAKRPLFRGPSSLFNPSTD